MFIKTACIGLMLATSIHGAPWSVSDGRSASRSGLGQQMDYNQEEYGLRGALYFNVHRPGGHYDVNNHDQQADVNYFNYNANDFFHVRKEHDGEIESPEPISGIKSNVYKQYASFSSDNDGPHTMLSADGGEQIGDFNKFKKNDKHNDCDYEAFKETNCNKSENLEPDRSHRDSFVKSDFHEPADMFEEQLDKVIKNDETKRKENFDPEFQTQHPDVDSDRVTVNEGLDSNMQGIFFGSYAKRQSKDLKYMDNDNLSSENPTKIESITTDIYEQHDGLGFDNQKEQVKPESVIHQSYDESATTDNYELYHTTNTDKEEVQVSIRSDTQDQHEDFNSHSFTDYESITTDNYKPRVDLNFDSHKVDVELMTNKYEKHDTSQLNSPNGNESFVSANYNQNEGSSVDEKKEEGYENFSNHYKLTQTPKENENSVTDNYELQNTLDPNNVKEQISSETSLPKELEDHNSESLTENESTTTDIFHQYLSSLNIDNHEDNGGSGIETPKVIEAATSTVNNQQLDETQKEQLEGDNNEKHSNIDSYNTKEYDYTTTDTYEQYRGSDINKPKEQVNLESNNNEKYNDFNSNSLKGNENITTDSNGQYNSLHTENVQIENEIHEKRLITPETLTENESTTISIFKNSASDFDNNKEQINGQTDIHDNKQSFDDSDSNKRHTTTKPTINKINDHPDSNGENEKTGLVISGIDNIQHDSIEAKIPEKLESSDTSELEEKDNSQINTHELREDNTDTEHESIESDVFENHDSSDVDGHDEEDDVEIDDDTEDGRSTYDSEEPESNSPNHSGYFNSKHHDKNEDSDYISYSKWRNIHQGFQPQTTRRYDSGLSRGHYNYFDFLRRERPDYEHVISDYRHPGGYRLY